jgi:hypothetical protein
MIIESLIFGAGRKWESLDRHGTYKKATKGYQKGEIIPPRVTQGRTASAQTAAQIQTRRASLEAHKIALLQGQVERTVLHLFDA